MSWSLFQASFKAAIHPRSIAVRKKKNVTEKMNQNKVAFSLSSLWRLPFLSPSNNPAATVVGMDQGSSRELNLPSKNIIIHQVLDAADMTIDLRKTPGLPLRHQNWRTDCMIALRYPVYPFDTRHLVKIKSTIQPWGVNLQVFKIKLHEGFIRNSAFPYPWFILGDFSYSHKFSF